MIRLAGCSGTGENTWRPFLQDIIPQCIGQTVPIDVYLAKLSDPGLERWDLSNTIEFIRACIRDGPPLGNPTSKHDPLRVLARVTQRHYCTHDPTEESNHIVGRSTVACLGYVFVSS